MEGDLQMVVGENLRRLRQQLGYSQESFGAHVGWHRTFVGAVERGERNLTLKTVERLAEQIEVHPLALLFDGDGSIWPVVQRGVRLTAATFAADGGTAPDSSRVGPRRPRPSAS